MFWAEGFIELFYAQLHMAFFSFNQKFTMWKIFLYHNQTA